MEEDKTKEYFLLNNGQDDFNSLVSYIGSVEDIEEIFGIEYAAGVEVEDDIEKVLFFSDYLDTDKEEDFLNKYDGKVEHTYFRIKDTGEIINLNEKGCRFEITRDAYYRYNGTPEFTDPKIITKEYAYPKIKGKRLKT